MAIKISGTTVIDDSRNLVNINSGLGVGIQSGGSSVGTGITVINFVGTGTTISVSGGRADISAGAGGGGGGTTLVVGLRTTAANVPVTSGVTIIGLRGGGTANLPV
jgi:hypothetical protein